MGRITSPTKKPIKCNNTLKAMTRDRRFEILGYCKDWQDLFNDMTLKDCFFALYDDRMIKATELDYLIDWMTL